jgi:tRNA threonylcarbamoyladenosine biosynthesis protein TsaE
MTRFVYEATNEEGTARLGAALAAVLPGGTTVGLYGTLGAGKTRLVQAIAEAAGVDRRDVLSPTFVLVQQHRGTHSIYHVDAYRIKDEDEFFALGVEEYFAGDGWVLIEWADRVETCLPTDRIEIHIDVTDAQSRRFEVVTRGNAYSAAIAELKNQMDRG